MPTKTHKEASVAELRESLGRARVAIVTDYRGLSVKEITDLRRRLQKTGADFTVAKNTLIQVATADQPQWAELKDLLKGPTALAIGYDDPVGPAKVLADFAKEKRKVEIKVRGGVLESQKLDSKGVKDLASLPSKEVLIAQLLSTLNAPITGFVNVLSGTTRNLVYALEAIRKQKEESGGFGPSSEASEAASEAPAGTADASADSPEAAAPSEASAETATASEAPAETATASEAPAAEAPATDSPATEGDTPA